MNRLEYIDMQFGQKPGKIAKLPKDRQYTKYVIRDERGVCHPIKMEKDDNSYIQKWLNRHS